jgi:hypothetical protein
MSGERACEAIECFNTVSSPKVFCTEHFAMVADDLRQRLWTAAETNDTASFEEVVKEAVKRIRAIEKKRSKRET